MTSNLSNVTAKDLSIALALRVKNLPIGGYWSIESLAYDLFKDIAQMQQVRKSAAPDPEFPDGKDTTITMGELERALYLSGHIYTAAENARSFVRTVLRNREPDYASGTVVLADNGLYYRRYGSGWTTFGSTAVIPLNGPPHPLTVIGETH